MQETIVQIKQQSPGDVPVVPTKQHQFTENPRATDDYVQSTYEVRKLFFMKGKCSNEISVLAYQCVNY